MKSVHEKTFKTLAVIQILIALGIVSFWTTFFLADLVNIDNPKLKEIYLAFESAFLLPDAWLVVSLVIGAAGLWKQAPYGIVFSLLAGASLIFLGLLDTSFNSRQGIYQLGPGEAVFNLAINLSCLAAGVVIIGITWKKGFKGLKKGAVS